MNRIDLQFLLLAAASLVVGVSLGIFMGINQDFTLSPSHAHLNLLGWASLALFGLVYRAYPELAAKRLAKVHFALAAPSALLLPVGIAISITQGSALLAIVAALAFGKSRIEAEPTIAPAE